MTSHIIGEAVFEITFRPDAKGSDHESHISRLVQSRLLPVIEEVFDEMALDRDAVRIDRLELDLGPVRDSELESELAARLREMLRNALRDYVLAREKTVVAASTPASSRSADLEKLAYFLRYGHLTWNTSVGPTGSLVDLLEEALLEAPDRIARLFEGGADFDTVVARLVSQFPESVVRDLATRLAGADPAIAAKLAAALRTQKKEGGAGTWVPSDGQSVVRAYELYDQLKRHITAGETRDSADLGPLIEELHQKYPWQLLRLYRELQAGDAWSIRIPDSYGVEDLRRLVDAFLSVVEETTHPIADFRQSIAAFAEKSVDRRAYYLQVFYHLARNEVLDLEEFSTRSGPPQDQREEDELTALLIAGPGDASEKLTGEMTSILARHPERLREWFRGIATDPLMLHRVIERLPELWLLQLLRLFEASSSDSMLKTADAVIEAARAAGMTLAPPQVALLKWEFIFSNAVDDTNAFRKDDYVDELGLLISDDVPRDRRELFLSRLRDDTAAAESPAGWDVLVRAYELYDVLLKRLAGFRGEESREINFALAELLQKYPFHVRKLYHEIQADAGLLMHIRQMSSTAELEGLVRAFLAVLYTAPMQEAAGSQAAARAVSTGDARRYYSQVLQRLIRTADIDGADLEALLSEPSTEESDEQMVAQMKLLLEDGGNAIPTSDLIRRFEQIFRERPDKAQDWLAHALSTAPSALSGALHLSTERVLIEVFLQFGKVGQFSQVGVERLATWIRAADTVADFLVSARASISEPELLRLKWAFLVRNALQESHDFQPEFFAAAFERHLAERLRDKARDRLQTDGVSVSERTLQIRERLADRSQPLDETYLVQVLRTFESPGVERLLLVADSAAHAFYRAGAALPDGEIARLKWEAVFAAFNDELSEDGEIPVEKFFEHFQSLLADRVPEPMELSLPQQMEPMDWSGLGRSYELYGRLRRALVAGEPESGAALVIALEEIVSHYPWQLLRLYREIQAGDGLSPQLESFYTAEELQHIAKALLTVFTVPTVSEEGAGAGAAAIRMEAIATFAPAGADRRPYYADVLEQLVRTGQLPELAEEFMAASFSERVQRIQEVLRDREQPLPERLLLQVLSESESPAAERLLQTADAIAAAYYRSGAALQQGEVERLKWELIFSDAFLGEPESQAAELREHFRALLNERSDSDRVRLPADPRRTVEFDFVEPGWIAWVRSYELYDRLRRTLVEGKPQTASVLMATLEEILRVYPWQLLRLYREMQAGDGLSPRVKEAYGEEELRRLAESLRTVSGGTLPAPDHADVLEQLFRTADVKADSIAAKVQRIRETLKDRSQPLPERLLVQVLSEMNRPGAAQLLRIADSITDIYYRSSIALPQVEIARLKWELIFSDAFLKEPKTDAEEFADRFRELLSERLDAGTVPLPPVPEGVSPETHAEEFAERFRVMLSERLDAGTMPLPPVPEGVSSETHAEEFAERLRVLRIARLDAAMIPLHPTPGVPAAEFEWTARIRSYELYDQLRQALVEGKPQTASVLMAAIEETLRVYPWQLLRLYREMQAGDGLSVRVKDFYGVEELRRIVVALLSVSEDADISEAGTEAIAAFAPAAADRRLYYADVLQQLVRTDWPSESIAELTPGTLVEKVQRIQENLKDRSQPLPERLLVRVLMEIGSLAAERLLRTADSMTDAYYRAGVVLPQSEIARLKWELIFSEALLEATEDPEESRSRIAEFAERFRARLRALLDDRLVAGLDAGVVPSAPVQPVRVMVPAESDWSAWIRAYELYDRLRRTLVEGRPDTASNRMAVLEETLRLYPWQLLRLYREMQAGDGFSARIKTDYSAAELQRIVEAFLSVSEEPAGAFDGLKSSIVAFARQSGDLRLYYAALLQQLVRREVIDLDLALTLSNETQPAETPSELGEGAPALLPSPLMGEREEFGDWQELVRSYDLYEELRRALIGAGTAPAGVKNLVDEIARTYPWLIRKLYRELQSVELQAGISRIRDAATMKSLIDAFVRLVRLDAPVVEMIGETIGGPTSDDTAADDAVQRYSRILQKLIRSRVMDAEVTPPLSSLPSGSPSLQQSEDPREFIRIAENMLRSGMERLVDWLEEMFSSTASAERFVRLLPDALMARILIAGAPDSNPAMLLVTLERLALASSTPTIGLSPGRARQLKWMFALRYALIEKRPFVESEFVKAFAAFIAPDAQLPDVDGLVTTLAGQMKIDGVSSLVRQEADKTYGAIELDRGIHIMNAGMVIAAPYLPRLFAELNLTEGRKFRDDESRERAVHLLQFMVTERENTPEHEMVLNKILCGMDTAAPIKLRIELSDREKTMMESLIRGMIQNWTKLGNTSVAGFRESFLQREGTLRLMDESWKLEVFPRAFDMLLDYIPWTFATIKHSWMDQVVHVQWRAGDSIDGR